MNSLGTVVVASWAMTSKVDGIFWAVSNAMRPFIIISLGICLLRIIWMATLFLRIHTLFVLCMCYPASWLLTTAVMAIYYKKGHWMDRSRMILEK